MDEIKGTNSTLCGFNRTTPCKSISEGLRKAKEFGAVFVVGKHHLEQTILVNKSIKIISDDIQQSVITTDKSHNVALILKCNNKLNLTLQGICFENIGVLVSHCDDSHISMNGILVKHATGATIFLRA